MSKSLTQKLEFQLKSSALYESNIIILPPVAPNASQPPLAVTTGVALPCEPRFLIRLIDEPDTGRSRWTTPEAARDAQMGSRIYPPYHRSARSVQSALEGMIAHEVAARSIQQDLERRAEAERRAERESNRPAYIIADAANGTAYEQRAMPTSPGDAGNESEEDTAEAGIGGEEESALRGAQQQGEEMEESEDDDAPGEIDPDSTPYVGASCQRCMDKRTPCNRRRPCQVCVRDGIAEEGCFLPRDSDSPEAIAQPAETSSALPSGIQGSAAVAADAWKTRGPGRNTNRRPTMRNFPSPPQPAPPPARATATTAVPSYPPPSAATASFFAPPALPVTRPPPFAPSAPTAPSTLANSELDRSRGRRKRKLTSPRPPLRNFPTDAERKELEDWLERHKND